MTMHGLTLTSGGGISTREAPVKASSRRAISENSVQLLVIILFYLDPLPSHGGQRPWGGGVYEALSGEAVRGHSDWGVTRVWLK